MQLPGPADQPPPEHPGQLQLLPGASSGSPAHVPEVQNQQAVVALAGAQQQLPMVGWVAYQLAPSRDFPLAHFILSLVVYNVWCRALSLSLLLAS